MTGLQGSDNQLFLNIGEMFFTMMACSLQEITMIKWMPDNIAPNTQHIPLNTALPPHQNSPKDAVRIFSQISKNSHPVDIVAGMHLRLRTKS